MAAKYLAFKRLLQNWICWYSRTVFKIVTTTYNLKLWWLLLSLLLNNLFKLKRFRSIFVVEFLVSITIISERLPLNSTTLPSAIWKGWLQKAITKTSISKEFTAIISCSYSFSKPSFNPTHVASTMALQKIKTSTVSTNCLTVTQFMFFK